MKTEKIVQKGVVTIVLTDAQGNVKSETTHNMVMRVGLEHVTGRLLPTGAPNAISHMAVGTGTTAAANTQTTLVNEIGRASNSNSTQVTTTTTNDSIQFVASFGPGVGTGALTEAGLFTASSGGTMVCRTVFAPNNKGVTDTITFTWKLTFTG